MQNHSVQTLVLEICKLIRFEIEVVGKARRACLPPATSTTKLLESHHAGTAEGNSSLLEEQLLPATHAEMGTAATYPALFPARSSQDFLITAVYAWPFALRVSKQRNSSQERKSGSAGAQEQDTSTSQTLIEPPGFRKERCHHGPHGGEESSSCVHPPLRSLR